MIFKTYPLVDDVLESLKQAMLDSIHKRKAVPVQIRVNRVRLDEVVEAMRVVNGDLEKAGLVNEQVPIVANGGTFRYEVELGWRE